jgi:hypothetical protein
MQITSDTTNMVSSPCIAKDKEARDLCVVIIKGTFDTDTVGNMTLAAEQRELFYVDEHFGVPESSSVRFEYDFAFAKTATDVVVVGKAMAPRQRRVAEFVVRLEVESRVKDMLVVGDRYWSRRMLSSLAPSHPDW